MALETWKALPQAKTQPPDPLAEPPEGAQDNRTTPIHTSTSDASFARERTKLKSDFYVSRGGGVDGGVH